MRILAFSKGTTVCLSLALLLFIASLQPISCRADDDDDDGGVEDEDDSSSSASKKTAAKREQPKEFYMKPSTPLGSLVAETFDGSADDVFLRWVKSKARKSGGDRYDGLWGVSQPEKTVLHGDQALVIKTKAKHHAIAHRLSSPFDFIKQKQLVVQYEVRFAEGMDCGGAYMKLLSHPLDSTEAFYDKSPFTIMFGPDKCGNDAKLHFIINFRNPKTGKLEEKHMKKPEKLDLSKYFTDKKTHLYTLVLNGNGADQSFEVAIDQKVIKSGSLTTPEDFDPALIPPAEIDDPKDKKPKDWDDRPKIADPEAKKPEDWDENEPEFIVDKDAKKPDDWLESEEKMIKDPLATKPDDWEDDMDGEWEAPLIDNPKCAGRSGCGKWEPEKVKNPKYKGKWSAPQIPNPAYKGEWKPRKIANPDYFEESDPYGKLVKIDAVGFELWTMTSDIIFDNILIADNRAAAEQFARETFSLKYKLENAGALSAIQGLFEALQDKPWLWIVVILVVAIPSALLIAYCCFGGSSSTTSNFDRQAAARRKKTDGDAQNGHGHSHGPNGEELDEEDLEDDDDDDEMPPLESQEPEPEEAKQEVRERKK